MRSLSFLIHLAVAFVVAVDVVPGPAQQGAIAGRVILPAIQLVKTRAQRGREYRNRQSLTRPTKAATKKKQPFAAVVISAHGRGTNAKPLSEPVMMEQLNLAFVPRVLPVTVGSTVQFVNYDRIYHNVFSLDVVKMNIGRRETGTIVEKVIDQTGAIELFCDIHPQMNGTILSLDTPYYTHPDSTGAFALGPLPIGAYEIRVFHPDLSHDAVAVEVTAGKGSDLELTLSR